MSGEPETLTLRSLRRIDEKLDRVIAKQDEHSMSISLLEQSVAHVGVSIAELSVRRGNFDRRVSRIERRLDLVEEGQS